MAVLLKTEVFWDMNSAVTYVAEKLAVSIFRVDRDRVDYSDHEDEGRKLLPKVRNYLPKDTLSYPRRLNLQVFFCRG